MLHIPELICVQITTKQLRWYSSTEELYTMHRESKELEINSGQAQFCPGALWQFHVDQDALKLWTHSKHARYIISVSSCKWLLLEPTVLHSSTSPSAVKVQREQTFFIPENVPHFHSISTGWWSYNASTRSQQRIRHDVTNISASPDKTISSLADRPWLAPWAGLFKPIYSTDKKNWFGWYIHAQLERT